MESGNRKDGSNKYEWGWKWEAVPKKPFRVLNSNPQRYLDFNRKILWLFMSFAAFALVLCGIMALTDSAPDNRKATNSNTVELVK